MSVNFTGNYVVDSPYFTPQQNKQVANALYTQMEESANQGINWKGALVEDCFGRSHLLNGDKAELYGAIHDALKTGKLQSTGIPIQSLAAGINQIFSTAIQTPVKLLNLVK